MTVLLISHEQAEYPYVLDTPTLMIQTEVLTPQGITCTRWFTYKETRTGEDGCPLLVYTEEGMNYI